jgi:uncharacterized membrane protein YhaH (DUF805 family)
MGMDRDGASTEAAGSIGSDFAGMINFLVDPRGAAHRLPRKFFWIAPLIVVSIVFLICGLFNLPLAQQAMMNQPPPANMPVEQFQKGMHIGLLIQKISIYLSPLLFVVFTGICAVVLFGTASAIAVQAKFLHLFNLMAGLSLIGALQIIATSVIIHAKGEPSSLADLQPALGLDIFAPAGMNKVAVAVLGFFNVFEVWEIAMAIAIVAVFYRIGKLKATVVVAPLFLLGLLFKIIGAYFSKTA